MSVREIMIKGLLVTLVVSTGQTHNFGNLRPAIPWSPMYRLLIPYIKPSVRESMIKSHWDPGLQVSRPKRNFVKKKKKKIIVFIIILWFCTAFSVPSATK